MTKSEYAARVRGKKIDTDGVPAPPKNPYQCADLIKDALAKVWNIRNFSFTLPDKNPYGYAKSLYENFDDYKQLKGKAKRIKNTAKFTPKLFDIVVWGDEVGKAGHVALSLGVNYGTTEFMSLDQNWGKREYVAEVRHRYTGVLGVIRMLQLVTTADLNVRAGAGKSFDFVRELPKGSLVFPYETRNGYTRIGEGEWVSSKYLE